MKIEFVHGPLDGQRRIVPDGTTFFECAMRGLEYYGGDDDPSDLAKVTIYRYVLNDQIYLSSGLTAFTLKEGWQPKGRRYRAQMG